MTLDDFAHADPRAFVHAAFERILGRAPTAEEELRTQAALARGDARTWILGCLRYGEEGRAHGAPIQGLRRRYVAQRLFRLPVIGALLEWFNAQRRLPQALREIRVQTHELARLNARIDAMLPPATDESFEVTGPPLAALARRRAAMAPDAPISTLPPDHRYALFESVFYESEAVAAKQRIYLRYLDDLPGHGPFLDLGCGRGEFLRILRDEGIPAVGVDINARNVAALRAAGCDVEQNDLVAFLETGQRRFSGASLLQVAEHLPHARLERALELLAARLLPGAVLIVETPNPLSPFALGVFHSDPTHVAPLPPEALRYFVEAAGFERSRTLFQARIPSDQLVGPDPRCYYGDYAIVAYRSSV